MGCYEALSFRYGGYKSFRYLIAGPTAPTTLENKSTYYDFLTRELGISLHGTKNIYIYVYIYMYMYMLKSAAAPKKQGPKPGFT